ncbi:MAG: hypothetical protein ABJL99_09745 [Aliishimia sp.]
MEASEDHTLVGRTFAHRNADASVGVQPEPASLTGRFVMSGVASAVVGIILGLTLAPNYVPALALGFAMTGVAASVAWFMWRSAASKAKAIELQAELHDLKQQEFGLRYEEAKANGQLDAWDKDE